MSPALLFLLAIITPFLIAAVLLLPVYAGIAGASYLIYLPASGPHPLDGRVTDIFYMIDVYQKLFAYWTDHMADADLLHYTLPIIGLPALGIVLALYLTFRLSRWLLNLFHLSSSR